MKTKVLTAAGMAFLLLFTVLIYRNSREAPFMFDDIWGIVENPCIRTLDDPAAIWRWNPPRFISNLTFAANYRVSGFQPSRFHTTSIAIHLINTCLVFGLISRIFSMILPPGTMKPALLALSGAGIFACHPVQTQAVTFIWQRFTIIAALFYLSTLLFYFISLSRESRCQRFASCFRALAYITGFAAMFTKQNAFTLPICILLMEGLFFGNPLQKGRRIGTLVWVGCLLIIPATTFYSGNLELTHIENIPDPITPFEYFFTQLNVVRTYLFLIFAPISQNLDYDYPVITTFFNWPTMGAACLHLSVVVLALSVYARSKAFTFGILFFYLALSVESSFLPLEDVIFEHRLYLPLFGMVLASMGLLSSALENRQAGAKGYAVLFAITLCIALAMGKLAWERNGVWASELSIWQDTAAKSPLKVRPSVNWGRALLKAGKPHQALKVLQRAEKLDPDFSTRASKKIPLFLALSHQSLNNEKAAEKYYQKAVDLTPDLALAHFNFGIFNATQKRWEKALKQLETAYRLDPDRPEIALHLGRLYMDIGRPDAAKAVFESALSKRYNSWEPYWKMAMEIRAMDPLLAARLLEGGVGAAKSGRQGAPVRHRLIEEKTRLLQSAKKTGKYPYDVVK